VCKHLQTCRCRKRSVFIQGFETRTGALAPFSPWGTKLKEVPVQTHVEFRSDRFPAYEGEEEQVNPGLWGKRLAEFLRDNLRREGFQAGEPIAEDWGWVVPVANEPFALWIGCANYQEYPDGFLCFIEPHMPFVRRLLKKIDTQEHVSTLQRAIDKILSEADGIREKRWWTHTEFMNPASHHPPQT
jgi:hypothetical protein